MNWTRPTDYTRDVALSNDARTIRTLGQLSTIGMAFVLALVLGFAGGNWLDRQLGTTPWLTLAGFAAGMAAGVLNVTRTMRAVTTAEHEASTSRDGPAGPRA